MRMQTKSQKLSESKTIAVVGGGVAGLFSAYLFALKGHSVTVFERSILPQDKACGEGLTFHGQKILQYFNILTADGENNSNVVEGIEFKNKVGTLRAMYPVSQKAISLRRTKLSALLISKLHEFSNVKILEKTPFIHDHSVQYDFIIGADGMRSLTSKQGNFTSTGRLGVSRTGFRQHFFAPKVKNIIQVFFTSKGDLYLTPLDQHSCQISLLTDTRKAPFNGWESFSDEIPDFKEYVDLSQPLSKLKAHGPLNWLVFLPIRKNKALIGDAFCTFDACTGVGMTKALKNALLISQYFPRLQNSLRARLICTLKLYWGLILYLAPCYGLLAVSYSQNLQKLALKLQEIAPKAVKTITLMIVKLIDYPNPASLLEFHASSLENSKLKKDSSEISPNITNKVG